MACSSLLCLFFFNDTATTEIYTLSLHDALPICTCRRARRWRCAGRGTCVRTRSEEHTSELQSPCNLVCRLLLEKKNNDNTRGRTTNQTAASPAAQQTRTLP